MITACETFPRTMLPPAALASTARQWLQHPGRRFGHLTARVAEGGLVVETLLLDTTSGRGEIFSALLPNGAWEYPSLTLEIPAAHWAERAAGDFFGVRALGHPRWKSLILHNNAWPADLTPLNAGPGKAREPYHFLEVEGEGIHEIPVGPIHAGIIEPGHFRFSCVGEIVTNLEIRLGYQHRGVEKRFIELPWQQMRYLAESASSDTAVGNALAHAVALEQLLGMAPPPRAQVLRTIALELERIANHIGDMGALSGDIGFSAGAALFPPLRTVALNLGQLLTGNRLQRWYVLPGGVARGLDAADLSAFKQGIAELTMRVEEHLPLVLENQAVIERMEGTGRLSASLARDFGLVGPAARASGSSYDARAVFPHATFPQLAPPVAQRQTGDVLARVQIRAEELRASLALVAELLEIVSTDGALCVDLDDHRLPPSAAGIGIVEAWRGELIHWVTTDETGTISRYAIKDPSFNNWTGLTIAVRGNLVADFPLCNKSFNLSYSGNDL
ncbi:MAG: NADH-quinone oxidoreductase subunit D-related protein [Armatimonadota bacterium]